MSKFDRPMTTNIGSASFSITIVTHYCPRSKFYANGNFSWQIKSYNYKIIHNKTYRTFNIKDIKDVFSTILQILRNVNMWLLIYELWKRTAHNDRNVNIQMDITTWQIISLLCCVCYGNKLKKTLFIWLLQNYNTC